MRVDAMIVVGVATALTAGCSEDAERAALPVWVVAETASVAIGAVDGESSYLFQEIAGAAFLADDRIVVADGGLSVLRLFDGDGSFLVEMGRDGDGPGEFRSLRDVWVLETGTLVAWDSGSLRLTYFRPDGTVARTVNLEPSIEAAGVGNLDLAVGPLADGSVALASLALGSPDHTGADRVSVERFGPEGAHLDRLAETTGFVRVLLGVRTAPAPFSPFPHFATHGQSVYFTNGRTPQVVVWSEGSERVIDLPPAEHDPDAAWAALARSLEEEGHEYFKSLLPEAPRSDSIPHLAGLLLDDMGQLWAKRYDPTTDAMWLGHGAKTFGGTWWVADQSGAVVARVAVPDALAPIEVMGDLMLGVTIDALGVERVQVHRITR